MRVLCDMQILSDIYPVVSQCRTALAAVVWLRAYVEVVADPYVSPLTAEQSPWGRTGGKSADGDRFSLM